MFSAQNLGPWEKFFLSPSPKKIKKVPKKERTFFFAAEFKSLFDHKCLAKHFFSQ
jgi:hypothetical protein